MTFHSRPHWSFASSLRFSFFFLTSLLMMLFAFASFADAATYYISPAGNNANSGISISAPLKTFAFAIPRLNPGDTLTLMNGTYDGSTSGYPNIDCTAGAKNGTAAAPITLKAQNERKAFLNGDG